MSLFQRIINQLQGPLLERIFFLHIPKCGGMSIGQAIGWCYLTLNIRQDYQFVLLDPNASRKVISLFEENIYLTNADDDYPILKFRENLLLYNMAENRAKYIYGHFLFSEIAYREFGNQYAFVTILRNPIKRWISSFFYNIYRKDDQLNIEADIDTYLQSKFGQSQGYEYVKFIGGINKANDYTSQNSIDRAKENLHKFQIVGCLEYQEDFLNRFEGRFGKRLHLEQRNQNPVSKSSQRSVITHEIEKKIESICKPDLEIYQYVVDNFVKMKL